MRIDTGSLSDNVDYALCFHTDGSATVVSAAGSAVPSLPAPAHRGTGQPQVTLNQGRTVTRAGPATGTIVDVESNTSPQNATTSSPGWNSPGWSSPAAPSTAASRYFGINDIQPPSAADVAARDAAYDDLMMERRRSSGASTTTSGGQTPSADGHRFSAGGDPFDDAAAIRASLESGSLGGHQRPQQQQPLIPQMLVAGRAPPQTARTVSSSNTVDSDARPFSAATNASFSTIPPYDSVSGTPSGAGRQSTASIGGLSLFDGIPFRVGDGESMPTDAAAHVAAARARQGLSGQQQIPRTPAMDQRGVSVYTDAGGADFTPPVRDEQNGHAASGLPPPAYTPSSAAPPAEKSASSSGQTQTPSTTDGGASVYSRASAHTAQQTPPATGSTNATHGTGGAEEDENVQYADSPGTPTQRRG